MGSFVISCISRSLHCFLSNCPEVAALSCKFSRTCRWIIALRMSDKPPVRQAQHCVLGFGCIRSGRQGSGVQRGAPREHWSVGSHEQVGLRSELLAAHVVLGWCRWLGEAVLLPEGCAGAAAWPCQGDEPPVTPTASSELCSSGDARLELHLKCASLGMCNVSLITRGTSTQKDCWMRKFSFQFLHFLEERDGRREQGLGSELKALFPVWPWICFWPFV